LDTDKKKTVELNLKLHKDLGAVEEQDQKSADAKTEIQFIYDSIDKICDGTPEENIRLHKKQNAKKIKTLTNNEAVRVDERQKLNNRREKLIGYEAYSMHFVIAFVLLIFVLRR